MIRTTGMRMAVFCTYTHKHVGDTVLFATCVHTQRWKLCCAVKAGVWLPLQFAHQAAGEGLLIIDACMAACMCTHAVLERCVAQHITLLLCRDCHGMCMADYQAPQLLWCPLAVQAAFAYTRNLFLHNHSLHCRQHKKRDADTLVA